MNTKKLAILASAIIAATCAWADKELIDGYTWEYTVANGEVTVTGVTPDSGVANLPAMLGGCNVKTIGDCAFQSKEVVIILPDGIERIERGAFNCGHVKNIPKTVKYIGDFAFSGVYSLEIWEIPQGVSLGSAVWSNFSPTELKIYAECDVLSEDKLPLMYMYKGSKPSFFCKRRYAANWIRTLGSEKFCGYIDDMPEVEIVSSAMRKDDPTVMDVVYKVHSSAQTVKVRAMAWENGERNLSKAIRPTKWIEGTEANIGDAITANEEHKLSWRIAGDWATDLSKVKLEVLAVEDGLLPLELQTIPATATHQKMKISWNKMTADHVFDALLWLYADGDAGLTLEDGQLKFGNAIVASNTSIMTSTGSETYYYDENGNYIGTHYRTVKSAVEYVFEKMGYQVLAGEELAYARRVTQLELPVGGVQQFAVKYPDAK